MNRYLFLCCAVVTLVVVMVSPITGARNLNGFDLSNITVPIAHVVHGGPPKDGIPAVLSPNYVQGEAASFMRDDDIVLGFALKGQFFAYPRYIMNWHELVNDQVNGEAFLITYCPLCGSGVAFLAQVDGKNLMFGVSGLVMNSDVLFYDKNTESLWSQLDQISISGDYAGTKLEALYLEHTTWKRWLKLHPTTKVLSENQGKKRPYRRDPYTGYDSSSRLYFKVLRKAPKTYHSKERVMGVQVGDKSKAYPFIELRKFGQTVFEDQLGGTRFKVLWDADSETATIVGLDGQAMVSTQVFWFAWYAFHFDTQVFKARDF